MKGELQNKRVLVRSKGVFIGVDVHKESWYVTVRVEGQEVFHGDIPTVNIMPSKGFYITSRIVRLPMKQAPVVSSCMINLAKMV